VLKCSTVCLTHGDMTLITRNVLDHLRSADSASNIMILQRMIDSRLASRMFVHNVRLWRVAYFLPIVEFVVCNSDRRSIEMGKVVV
jgi:hypothetical protein